MKSSIFIPEKLKVGFQERQGTYTGKLAYVTYLDQNGVLRKEKSWEGWRDKKIEPLELENLPTSGFVLNKKVGGYSGGWNHRQSYVRVYDPRDFEFEITISNLLYILENANSMKGKGLEGEFVLSWDGQDLVLLPTSSPDYVELTAFNALLHQNQLIKPKELILGATYLTKNNAEWTYMGKFESYNSYSGQAEGKKHFFAMDNYTRFVTLKSLGDKLIGVVSGSCISNYADMMELLQSQTIYSPHDPAKDEYMSYNFEAFKNLFSEGNWLHCFTHDRVAIQVNKSYQEDDQFSVSRSDTYRAMLRDKTLEDTFNTLKPKYVKKYLKNGNPLN
jgi:hypothetical protein